MWNSSGEARAAQVPRWRALDRLEYIEFKEQAEGRGDTMATFTLRILLAVFCATVANPSRACADTLSEARGLWQTGKYAEAEEAFSKARSELKPDDLAGHARAALGIAGCASSQGEIERALEILQTALKQDPTNADLLASRGEIEFQRGRWAEAEAEIKAALNTNPNHLHARFVAARLLESKGQKAESIEAYRWFIDHQNQNRTALAKDSESLILLGQAAEKYYRAKARGQDLSETLNDVINEIYEQAIRVDPKCWQAPWLEGRLFLAGYNERSAMKELNRALRINPNAAEVLVTLGQADLQGYKLAAGRKRAEDALEINPHYWPALVLLADLNISDERFVDALAAANKAVSENPRSQEALGRLAASHRLLVEPAGAAAAEAAALASNPQPAVFFAALGERLSDRRKYLSAERAFLKALEYDPAYPDAQIGLGMLYMQIGREDEANDLFVAAFDADPFNVRALNMMKVLEHLASYEAIETEHYRVLVLPDQDALLGKYMSRFLEEQHADLAKRFGFDPPGKTTIEIMKDHQWFSGRTTGLPFIPTVGACTGKVVALASTRTLRKPFNWARVLVHEVTHVITLQQTEFNIPHWYTEALAVESERTPRPQSWNKMLLERIPQRKLLNLDTINLGFIRPKEADERQLAYAQSQLYAQYMVQRFGEDALIKLLDAYRRGLTTDKAITDCFAVEKQDFEAGYLQFLDEVVKTIRTRIDDEESMAFSKLEQMVKAKPDDSSLNARMAYEHFARRDLKAARPFADKALAIDPKQPLACYVKARLYTSIGDDDEALKLLRSALDEQTPNERLVDLLAELEMKAGNLDEAERLYELARRDDPYHSKWIAGLARVHLRQNQRAKLLGDLAMLASNDADDLDVRKALAENYLKDEDFALAEKWAQECLYIQVYEPVFHQIRADAFAGLAKHEQAVEEFRIALELRVKRPNDVRVRLAKSLVALGREDEARTTLDQVLTADPEHPEALELQGHLKAAPQ